MTGITDVNVIITKETAAVTQAGFGLPLIVGTAGETGFDDLGYRVCENLSQVAALVPAVEPEPGEEGEPGTPGTPGTAGTEVYKIAQKIFGQTPAPQKVAVVWLDLTNATTAIAGINEILAEGHNDWYFLLSDSQNALIIDAFAEFAAANDKIYFVSMTKEVLDALSPATTANERAVGLAHKNAATQYPAEGWVGRCAPEDPGSITWKFKSLNGIGVSGYNPTEIAAIKEKNCNVVVSQGGILHTSEGVTFSGEYIDVIRSQDWVKARIAENVFRLLATSPKIPYDDRGIAMVLSEVQGVMQQAVGMGIIARDPDGNGLWSVTAPRRGEIPTNEIANRTLPDVRFEFTLAGAIHNVTVKGVISL